MTESIPDLQAMPEEEFYALHSAVMREDARRVAVKNTPAQISALNRNYLTSAGIQEGEEWRAPESAVDAYPEGWIVVHNGVTWVSTVPANVWEPGVSGWHTTPDEDGYVQWVQPSGAHDAYRIGSYVRHDGKEWVSTIEANVWEPGVHGWEVVEDVEPDPEPDPNPEPGPDPEPDPDPVPDPEPEHEAPQWVQPTGGHDAYNTGDLVTFEGKVYRSKIAGNTWSPTAYPQGWELVQGD